MRAVLLLALVPVFAVATDPPQQRPRGEARPAVLNERLTPHWLADNARFWYRTDQTGGGRAFVLVDAAAGTKGPAFDHAKLAAGLAKATGKQYATDKLPFDAIAFAADGKSVTVRVGTQAWACDLGSYLCTKSDAAPPPEPTNTAMSPEDDVEDAPLAETQQRPQGRGKERDGRSPDRKWTAVVKDHNLVLRAADGKETPLTADGTEAKPYGLPSWAPDSSALAAFRITPGEEKQVHLIESSPKGGGRAVLSSRPYPLPGDRFTKYELHLFDPATAKPVKCAADPVDFGFPRLRWAKDGHAFTYQHIDRGHQRFRLVEVDAKSGAVRNVIDERSNTFLWTTHFEAVAVPTVSYLEKSADVIYASEKSGWRHLYLIDTKTGTERNAITRGEWVVRGIDHIDEDKRQVWFRASGMHAGQDPYFVHHYRVNFDGTGLTPLTAGDGTHTAQFSPTREYVVDTFSRVDAAPVHELRRTADGSLVSRLEAADVTDLKATGWDAPEVFVAKGRDGVTDIWGIVCRPKDFDPAKKYPVIEQIYAGPHGAHVPKAFSGARRFAAFTDLGFVVVQIDGMGTAHRSKAFHDVCWKNLKDAGFPDRILWHQAVAKKYPWYDVSRVGLTGGSAGGQNAVAGLLWHGDFYKAAVAGCGCHDNRMDKASWNEQWMGYPVGPQYAACSNIDHAGKLTGKLLLIVGELDTNVPPESTYRLCDALIKAGKDFDFVLVPGGGHGMGGAYGARRQQDFFVRHLQGGIPPDRNAPAQEKKKVADVTAPPDTFFDRFPEADRPAARTFYAKHLDVGGLSIAAAGVVEDAALLRTREIVGRLLAGRPDVLAAMQKAGTRLIIIGQDQVYTDMPDYRNSPNPAYLNERVRGTGGLRVTSFGEENLLNRPTDRYDDESIVVHEFCHTVDAALGVMDPTWKKRLRQTYRAAMDTGLWRDTYAASNPAEYWAEIAQCYFDCNRVNNWNHGPIGTREQLKQYDPAGYELVRTTFNLTPATDWRYAPVARQPSVIAPPPRYKLDPYYTKLTLARELPVVGSAKVSDAALLAANDTVRKMMAYRHDVLKAIMSDGGRLVVLGQGERLADLPEFRDSPADAARYLDFDVKRRLLVVPEESVLRQPTDPLAGRSAVVAALARAMVAATATRPPDPAFDRRRDVQQYELRVKRLDTDFDARLKELHAAAVAKGLWKGTPAGRDRVEYWAAGVEAYFDAGGGVAPAGEPHPVAARPALERYDAGLYKLVTETMAYTGKPDWRYGR